MYIPRSLTASATLGAADSGVPITLNAAAGLTVTLPAAAGTGRVYEIIVGTTIGSNTAVVKVANSSDIMTGVCITGQDAGDTLVLFETASDTDTITMNGSTKGGIKGDRIYLRDITSNLWYVSMLCSGTSSEVTPFSAAV